MSRRRPRQGPLVPGQRSRRQQNYGIVNKEIDPVDVGAADWHAQDRRQPVRLPIGVIDAGRVTGKCLMRSEMAVYNARLMLVTGVAGVQMLLWEQQQRGDRQGKQTADDRLACPPHTHPGIMPTLQSSRQMERATRVDNCSHPKPHIRQGISASQARKSFVTTVASV